MLNKELLSVNDLVEMLTLSKSTIYAYAEKGILRAVILPSINSSQASVRNRKTIRFRPSEVERFMKSLEGWSSTPSEEL
jgi:hypothetical protein